MDKLEELSKFSVAQPTKKRKNYVKRVEHEWSHEEILRLISAVEERRVLWDIDTAEYRLPKTDAWKEVADTIGNVEVDDAKAKWTNLRISFKNNLAKYRSKKSGQGTDETVVINWRYFKSIMFLESNDIQQSTESTSSLPLASANNDASVLDDFSATPPIPSGVGKRKRGTNAGPSETPSLPLPANAMKDLAYKALSSLRMHNDKFGAFGDYIASELRALPPDQGAFVQRELNRKLLTLLEETAKTPTPPPIQFIDESGHYIDPSTIHLNVTMPDD